MKYFKNTLLSTMNNPNHSNVFENLATFCQSEWIPSCLEHIIEDKYFVEKIKLFTPRKFLNNMSLFQFIFFACEQYQIATYVVDSGYINSVEVIQMIIGNDLFIQDNDDWIQSVDRSTRHCSTYQPRMCTMNIVYEYDDNNKISMQFGTKQGKAMLINTNLMLQHIDQRKLDQLKNELTMYIDAQIKYQHQSDGNKSSIRIWRYNLKNYKCKIMNKFNWKINHNTNLTYNNMYIGSLWVTNKSTISDVNEQSNSDQTVRFVCQDVLLIDSGSSIDINQNVLICCDKFIINGKFNCDKNITTFTNQTNISGNNIKKIRFGFVDEFCIQYLNIEEFKKKQDVKLYSYQLLQKLPMVQLLDMWTQIHYLKTRLTSIDINDDEKQNYEQKEPIFTQLSKIFKDPVNREWIKNCLQYIMNDEQFIERVNLFSSNSAALNGMSLFQFLFFECGYYHISSYLKTDNEN
eukprot:274259_1